MASIRRERGVLKLVHAGRYVEVHREPIRAEEVMRKNPRHFITRPDVFEFPWIVVKPESLLLPGSVFFVVPFHTIYDLLKAKGQSNHYSPFSQHKQLSPRNNHVHQQQIKQHSPITSNNIKGQFGIRKKGGERREVERKLHFFNKLFLSCLCPYPFCQRNHGCQPKEMCHEVENMCIYDFDKRSQNQYQVEMWPRVISYEDTLKQGFKLQLQLLEESSFETRPYDKGIQYQKKSKDNTGKEMPKKDAKQEFVSNEQVTMLKSCFRRADSIRTSLNLKVSFNIPINKEEQQMGYSTELKANFMAS